MGKKIPFFDIKREREPGVYWYICVGLRGGGKTYSNTRDLICDREPGKNFLYIRRTLDELNISTDPMYPDQNPFLEINQDFNRNVEVKNCRRSDKLKRLYEEDEFIGFATSLNEIHKYRGMDIFRDTRYMYYDEFIPQENVRKMTGEGKAILNLYETVNRDRELKGEEPVIFTLTANSNDISHDLFVELHLVELLERMKRRGQKRTRRGKLKIIYFEEQDFIDLKKETVLYQLTKGTDFYEMALNNQFAYNDFSDIESKNLIEYKPVCKINGITVFRHKSRYEYYVTTTNANCKEYKNTQDGKIQFLLEHGKYIRDAYIYNSIYFASYLSKKLLTDVLL